MKYLFIILLVFCLSSCDKSKNELPPEYSFLIGKWRCTDCNDETTVIIEKDRLFVYYYANRNVVIPFRDIRIGYSPLFNYSTVYLRDYKLTVGGKRTVINVNLEIKDSIKFRSYLASDSPFQLKKE